MRRAAGALVVAASIAGALPGCHARPRRDAPPPGLPSAGAATRDRGGVLDEARLAAIDLTRGAPEAGGSSLFSTPSRTTFAHLVRALHALAVDDDVKGVLVRFGGARVGWSRAYEIAELLSRVRAKQKFVTCHAEDLGNATLFIAARGCDRVWMSPAGGVDAVGVAAQVVYANRLLTQRLGVDVDMLQIGKFKGAEEPLTRDGPSPEARASLESTLRAIRDAWAEGVGRGRGEVATKAAEDGPFSPAEAKARGLIDAIGYFDEARDDAKARAESDAIDVRFGSGGGDRRPGLAEILRTIAGEGAGRAGDRPHVALVRAVGSISMEGGGGLLGGRSGITEHALGRTIRKLVDDEQARAIVLRIDSPGGSALASDLLWHELMKLRAAKPIVVSIGDMAASGGYYLASTGTRIVAEPTSIVGSIGVVGGKLAFGNAIEQLGLHAETFSPLGSPTAATRAAYESPLVAWDDATRDRVRSSMTAIYELFLARVAEGRGMTVARVAESAEGRIFAGETAKARGLVDEWGGLDDAIATARDLGKLAADAPVVMAGEASSFEDLFAGDDEGEESDERALSAVARAFAEAALPAGSDALELSRFASSVAPLAASERAVAALPYAITLR